MKEYYISKGLPIQICPYQRKIKLIDSLLFIACPLDDMISQLHTARQKEGLSLEESFFNTVQFAKSRGYSDEQIKLLCFKKISMPYEMATSFSVLENTTECPEAKDFKSVLRGHEGLEPHEMEHFHQIWTGLGIKNLLELFHLYQVIIIKSLFCKFD